MKKTIWIILVLLLMCVLVLSNCDSGDAPPSNDAANQTVNNYGGGNNEVDTSSTACEHVSSVWITDKVPTCKEAGSQHKECTKCEEVIETASIDMLTTHTPSEAVSENHVDSDCKTEGSYNLVVYCSVCEAKLSTEVKTVEKKPHSPVIDEVVQATCTKTGLTEGKHCSSCGETLVAQEIVSVANHTEIEHKAKDPTYTEVGWNAYVTCKNCDYTTYKELPVLPAPEPTEGLVFTLNSDGTEYSVTKYTGTATEVFISATYEGKPVTAIGKSAFSYCTSLVSIHIPNSVIFIDDNAFYNCDSLTAITIPDSVISISEWAFLECDGLINIEVDNNNPSYCSVDGNLFDNNKTTLMRYAPGKEATEFTVPDGVISIGYAAFSGCRNLMSITITDSVTSIDSYAFYYCKNLVLVTIPDSVTDISSYGFFGCTKLETVNYTGTEDEWATISIGSNNSPLQNATIVYN